MPCLIAIIGGLLGGWIDARYGSHAAIRISVAATIAGMVAAVSVTPTHIFFVPYDAAASGPVWSLPYFRTLPELVFLGIFMVLALGVTAAFGTSRALMARIAPLAHMSQFFGLYALSGTATAFMGHGLVALFTRAFLVTARKAAEGETVGTAAPAAAKKPAARKKASAKAAEAPAEDASAATAEEPKPKAVRKPRVAKKKEDGGED